MNREAVALGMPVYTTYGGRLGGVDEALIREGRLRPLTSRDAIEVEKRPPSGERERRDPALLADLALEAALVAVKAVHAAQASAALRPTGARRRPRREPHEGETLAERYSRMAHEGWRPARRRPRPARRWTSAIAVVALLVLSPLLGLVVAARPARLAGPGGLPRPAGRQGGRASSRCSSSARCRVDAESGWARSSAPS